ncbi:MAG TPA: tetratricopeptide repeat protein [Candidatus Sulfotelmatobacter sp.]|nr:tetratricopeptide repeat protein [Candidatus Sulfotelmatobacter sp.]
MKLSPPIRQQKTPVPAPRPGPPELLSPLNFLIVATALIIVIFAAYSPALSFQFILDDHRFVNDPRVQSSGHVWDYFTNYVWAQFTGGPTSFYRPVFVLWMRLNFILNEMSPWGWHFLSIVKHVLVAVLLGLLVWKLLRDRSAALMASALFALHPAHTESVAWVTVPDPLMSAAVLGSVLCHLRYADKFSAQSSPPAGKSGRKFRKPSEAEARSSVAWLIASAVVCLVALFAKETAIVLIPVLFALALVMPSLNYDGANLGSRLFRALCQIIPLLCVTVIYLLLRLHALGGRLGARTQNLSWSTVARSVPATLWFYLKVLLWPVRLRAFADSSEVDTFSARDVLLPGLGVGCALMVIAAALLWAWKKTRDLPDREAAGVECALVLGSLFLVLPILLALNLNALNPGDFLHGRYTYLSLTGLMLLLATGWHLMDKLRIASLAMAGMLAIVFTGFTVRQENAWKDDLTVFTVAHQIAPHNAPVALNLARAHVQVALQLGEAGRCNEAVVTFNEVIREFPQDWYAWAGLGECLLQLNDLARAEQSLHRAAELSHEPRVTEEWQELRGQMGLPSAPQ